MPHTHTYDFSQAEINILGHQFRIDGKFTNGYTVSEDNFEGSTFEITSVEWLKKTPTASLGFIYVDIFDLWKDFEFEAHFYTNILKQLQDMDWTS
jgi:hypothetical protein